MTAVVHIVRDAEVDLRAVARSIYDSRRTRDRLFGASREFLGEPAWDIMLDLFARGRGRHTSVTGCCIGSVAATSTALRCIGKLEASGILERERDVHDARRAWLHLTSAGEELMIDVLEEIRGPLIALP